eukprot:Awhi_evm1s15439
MFSNRVTSLDESLSMGTFAAATTVNFKLVNHTDICPAHMEIVGTASDTWVSYS